MQETYLKIENIKVWARVGVLNKEREFGQLFSLDVFLWSDFKECTDSDDINKTIDYSVLINDIKNHSKRFSCKTIEKYSSEILNLVISLCVIGKKSEGDLLEFKETGGETQNLSLDKIIEIIKKQKASN